MAPTAAHAGGGIPRRAVRYFSCMVTIAAPIADASMLLQTSEDVYGGSPNAERKTRDVGRKWCNRASTPPLGRCATQVPRPLLLSRESDTLRAGPEVPLHNQRAASGISPRHGSPQQRSLE